MFGKLGMGELVIILVIVLLIFGPSKLPSLAKSMGQAIKEFRKGSQDVSDKIEKFADEPVVDSKKPEKPAAPASNDTATKPADK